MEFKFNPNDVEPDQGFDNSVLPDGDYTIQAIEVEPKQTKANNGSWYFNFMFEIIDGEKKGRRLWHMFNMQNQSAKCMEIGHRQYSALHGACGKGETNAPEELLNLPLVVTVGTQRDDAERNEIKKFHLKGAAAQAPQTPTPSTPATLATPATPPAADQVQPADAKMPWE